MPCPKCGKKDFDEATGYGFRELVAGVRRRVCDECGLPKAELEVESRLTDVDRFEIEHRGVNHEEARKLAEKAAKVLALWRRPEYCARTTGFVRQAYEHARKAFWVLREQTVVQRLAQARQILDKVGRIEVTEPRFQQDLDFMLGKITEGMSLAKRDLARERAPGIRGKERRNLLKDAVENAELAFRQAVGYQRRQTKIDEETARRQIAAAFEASAPADAEEEEAAVSVAAQPPTASTPFEGVAASVAEETVTEQRGVSATEAEQAGVSAVVPPPVDKPRSRKKTDGKKAKTAKNSGDLSPNEGRRSFKFNGVDADDPREITRALRTNGRQTGCGSRSRMKQEAIAVATDLEE